MKTTCFQLLHRMTQIGAIISVLCFTGCANFDDFLENIAGPPEGDGVIIGDMPIAEIEVLLAESDPVQVSVEVTGWLPDSCTEHHETHLTQEENTIAIQITTIRPKDFACATVVTEYQERISIGTLSEGDYKVIVNDVEAEFRVD